MTHRLWQRAVTTPRQAAPLSPTANTVAPPRPAITPTPPTRRLGAPTALTVRLRRRGPGRRSGRRPGRRRDPPVRVRSGLAHLPWRESPSYLAWPDFDHRVPFMHSVRANRQAGGRSGSKKMYSVVGSLVRGAAIGAANYANDVTRVCVPHCWKRKEAPPFPSFRSAPVRPAEGEALARP